MENSEPGENPGRYRRCMRGGTARDESQSLGVILRRQCGELMIRESEDLLKCVAIYLLSTYGEIGVFALQKIGCGSLLRLPQLFVLQG